MVKYILKRVGQAVLIIFLVSIITFFLVSIMPKDPVYALFGSDISLEDYQVKYVELGLDKPIIVRYLSWLGGVLKGDFGTSYQYRVAVTEVMASKIGVTLYLAILSTLISFPIGILFGVLTAVKRGKWQDTVFTLLANLCASIPGFVVALVCLWIFCMKLQLLPSSGFTFPWKDWSAYSKQIVMPLFCLSLSGIASLTRQTRSSMLEAIRQDYVRTARSKGIKENKIITKHVIRNGLVPVITLFGDRLSQMIGGSVFIENVFTIPGMGTLMVNAVNSVDVPVIQACVFLTSAMICFAYLVTDMLYIAVDPRITLN